MARYRVTLFYKETVEVEACTWKEATNKALDMAEAKCEWDEVEAEEITFPEPFELNNAV